MARSTGRRRVFLVFSRIGRRARPPRAQQDRVLEAAPARREECHRATERLPVAAEIDALAAELTGQPGLLGAIRPSRRH